MATFRDVELQETRAQLARLQRTISETLASIERYDLESDTSSPEPRPPLLPSGIESEVLRLVALGLKNRQVAERLAMSEKNVERYITKLNSRFKTATRVQLLNRAREEGLL